MLDDPLIITMAHEKARIGIFIILAPPTTPTPTEAGFYESSHHAKVPKIQIMTIQQLFELRKPEVPMMTSVFKKAGKEDNIQPGHL